MGYRQNYVFHALHNSQLMTVFRNHKPLPCNYGSGLDERVVEYPWVLSRIHKGSGRILDPGATLNYEYICTHPSLSQKNIVVYTLSPDGENQILTPRMSYIYGDLRDILLRDNAVDDVVSISTVEHIGMNNYTQKTRSSSRGMRGHTFWPFGNSIACSNLAAVCYLPCPTVVLKIWVGSSNSTQIV
jgi:hypothetical protein